MEVVRPEVFVSHTKMDADFCDIFDRACARVGIKAFRSEFETIPPPPWKVIKDAIIRSRAVFLLVGKNLIEKQATHGAEWEYTQNWIAFEVGLASMRGIDVWVICDDVEINFPVPYFNNYTPHSIRSENGLQFMRWFLDSYARGNTFSFFMEKRGVTCPHENCKINFNLHAKLQAGEKITCPHCLKNMVFSNGFLLT